MIRARSRGVAVALEINGEVFAVSPDDPRLVGVEIEPYEPPAPPPPPPVRVISALSFLERLTPDERIRIRRAAKVSEGLEDWLDMLRAAQEVDLDDPRTVSGLNAMVNAGLLSPKRRDEILEIE